MKVQISASTDIITHLSMEILSRIQLTILPEILLYFFHLFHSDNKNTVISVSFWKMYFPGLRETAKYYCRGTANGRRK